MRSNFPRLLLFVVCVAVVFGSASIASACPSCQQALKAGHGDLARGIYYSVLFMMSMPFAIVGTFGTLAYRAVKREQRRQAEEARKAHDQQPGDAP
jgi:hypothetical protein